VSQAGFDGGLDSRVLPWGEEGFKAMPRPRKYPPELLDRGVRVVIESGRPIAHVARDLGVPAETLRRHVRQVEADEGLRPDLPSAAEREEIKALRQEVYELRRANEILKAASVFFATELDADRPK
jgi:transposase